MTVDILSLLLSFKANPNFRDSRGRTALHQACRQNNITAVDFLLNNTIQFDFKQQGEFVRAAIDVQSSGGETPLMMAIDEGNIHVMRLLFS